MLNIYSQHHWLTLNNEYMTGSSQFENVNFVYAKLGSDVCPKFEQIPVQCLFMPQIHEFFLHNPSKKFYTHSSPIQTILLFQEIGQSPDVFLQP